MSDGNARLNMHSRHLGESVTGQGRRCRTSRPSYAFRLSAPTEGWLAPARGGAAGLQDRTTRPRRSLTKISGGAGAGVAVSASNRAGKTVAGTQNSNPHDRRNPAPASSSTVLEVRHADRSCRLSLAPDGSAR